MRLALYWPNASADPPPSRADITFRDAGVEAIEVKDNGKGIDQSDWEGIGAFHPLPELAQHPRTHS